VRKENEEKLTAIEDLSSRDSAGSDTSEDEIWVELPHVSGPNSSVTDRRERKKETRRVRFRSFSPWTTQATFCILQLRGLTCLRSKSTSSYPLLQP